MSVGDVKKNLPKDDDEIILVAWWEDGNGEMWPDWLTQELWDDLVSSVEGYHDWSMTHDTFCWQFDDLRPKEEEE